ncbi:hypothetical protein [Streptomyces milbemycinicus]|uniref:hypothetical protein n=1 Tax=Streptomyces milbemycinicus TaxID=476552 RepID=UPI003408B6E8
MDAGVWVGAIFGVCGTVVGGGLSIWATAIAQRQQAQAARQLVIDQRVDTAADSAIQMFFQIKQHVRGRPSERAERAREHIIVWEKALDQQVSKLEPVLLRIRDREFRLRLSQVAEFLAWRDVMEPQLGGSPDVLGQLCEHALECLGAFVRDEPLPPEEGGMSWARRVEQAYGEVMEGMAEVYENRNMRYGGGGSRSAS